MSGIGDFDGLVNAAGAGGEGGLENVGAVGGQDEEHVGVLGKAVHLIEQFEEQGVGADGLMFAHGADQIDVFKDDGHGREGPREHDADFDGIYHAASEDQDGALRAFGWRDTWR